MPTTPFGAVLEQALKQAHQSGRMQLMRGTLRHPKAFCCVSGTTVGVDKDPVAVLSLSTHQACMMEPVTATYSHSWSPSSTINSWSIDWGDGNISAGAWPGPGSVVHPGGGYALPGPYIITLTVTDLLGAFDSTEVEIQVIDCTAIVIEMFAGCGASGPYHTHSGGILWENIGSGTLDAEQIYDLVVNPFTLWGPAYELWAATELGLYCGKHSLGTGAQTWTRITLPSPMVGVGEPTARAIACSKFDSREVYVITDWTDIDATTKMSLYRTTDSGETWTYITFESSSLGLGIDWVDVSVHPGWTVGAIVSHPTAHRVYVVGDLTDGVNHYSCGYYDEIIESFVYMSNNGLPVDYEPICVKVGPDSRVYIGGSSGVHYWDGAGWVQMCAITPIYTMAWDASGTMYIGTWGHTGWMVDPYPTIWVLSGVWTEFAYSETDFVPYDYDTWVNDILFADDGTMYVSGQFNRIGTFPPWIHITSHHVAKHVGSSWQAFYPPGYSAWSGPVASVVEDSNHDIWISSAHRYDDGTWTQYDDNYININFADLYSGEIGYLHVAGYVGTFGNHIATTRRLNLSNPGAGWENVFGDATLTGMQEARGTTVTWINGRKRYYVGYVPGVWYHGFVYGDPYAELSSAAPTSQSIDTTANGLYVFVTALDETGTPIVIRVLYDLSEHKGVYNSGAGTWAGVTCDPYYANAVWIYGDFGAGKVCVSVDYGDTWTDVTDPLWNVNEVVRSLLISIWDSRDIVAILNTVLEVWHTEDTAETWHKNGDIPFACACAARDPYEPNNLWIGREVANALHLQYSPSLGAAWREFSTGFTPNAPVTALEVVA